MKNCESMSIRENMAIVLPQLDRDTLAIDETTQ